MKTITLFLLGLLGLLTIAFSQPLPCGSALGGPCRLQHINRDFFTRVPAPRITPTASRSTTFVVDTTGYGPQVGPAFLYATDIWASLLHSSVPIRISFLYLPVSGFLGFALPNGARAFPGAPDTARWYASALADAITGVDQNPGEVDMTIIMPSTPNWYFGLDGNTPAGMVDFVSVALHEIGHGLGFVSLGKLENNGEGSLGEISFNDFSLPPLPIPFPDLMGFPGMFDNYLLHQGSGFRVTNTQVFPNPSVALGSVFTGNDLYFSGPYALAANNQMAPRIYAPAVFALGSSLSHLDENTYPPGDTNTLMTPFIGNAEATHSPGPIMLGVLRDLGWPDMATDLEEEMQADRLEVFPNPFSETLHLRFTLEKASGVRLQVFDLTGKEVSHVSYGMMPAGAHTLLWKDPGLLPGLYVYQLEAGEKRWRGKAVSR